MFTRMPSPLVPLTIAVTTTNVSLATKFRMHRSFLLSCDCDVACRSNFNALAQAMKRTRLQTYCSSDRGSAMVVVVDAVCVWAGGSFLGTVTAWLSQQRSIRSLLQRCRVHLRSSSMPGVAPSPVAYQSQRVNVSVGPIAPRALPDFSLAAPWSSSLLLLHLSIRLFNFRDTTTTRDRVNTATHQWNPEQRIQDAEV